MQRVALHVEPLDVGDAANARDLLVIDEEERRKAARFRFDRDARRFVARRARLRMLLAPYTGEAPERLCFALGPHGKPVLGQGAPHFSLSHSQGVLMLAIADVAVGCDIEAIDPDLDWQPLAERLFAPAEREALRLLPAAAARRGFFDCWSRKEAYVKALGQGLSHPLDIFTVSVGREAQLCAEDGWAIVDASPDRHFSAAVVARADAIVLA